MFAQSNIIQTVRIEIDAEASTPVVQPFGSTQTDSPDLVSIRIMREQYLGRSLLKDAVLSDSTLPGSDCSINWFRAIPPGTGRVVFNPAKPVPEELKQQLDGMVIDGVLRVDWNGEEHIVVCLATADDPLFIGESIRAEGILLLTLFPARLIDFQS